MKTKIYKSDSIKSYLVKCKIATMDQLKTVLGTTSTRTVSRNLKELSYCRSYSHSGKFYTLPKIAKFDKLGIWDLTFR